MTTLTLAWAFLSLTKSHVLNSTTLDKEKKEPYPKFAARRPLFHHVISCSISAEQKSRIVADDHALRWSLVFKYDITWSNSVLLAANLRDGSFLSRVVVLHYVNLTHYSLLFFADTKGRTIVRSSSALPTTSVSTTKDLVITRSIGSSEAGESSKPGVAVPVAISIAGTAAIGLTLVLVHFIRKCIRGGESEFVRRRCKKFTVKSCIKAALD